VTVTVSNAAGSVVSNPAALMVTAAPVAPVITVPPSLQSVKAEERLHILRTGAEGKLSTHGHPDSPPSRGVVSPWFSRNKQKARSPGPKCFVIW
jgi:hypothetical protein